MTLLDDARSLAARLRDEARYLLGWLGTTQLWALLGLALLAWSLAYQGFYQPRLAVGGDLETRKRRFDEPYLRGFNASEPEGDRAQGLEWWDVAAQPGAFPYRWAESNAAIVMPGLGGGPWLLTLGASSGRQQPVETLLGFAAGEQPISVEPGQPRRYMLALPAVPRGDLELLLTTPRLDSPGDPRDLGLVVTEVQLTPLPAPLRAPAWRTLLLLTITLALCYGLLRRLDVSQRWAGGALFGLALLLAGLLLRGRLPLTIFAPMLPWLLLACYALAVLLATLWPRLPRLIVLLVTLGFALRLGGLLHPHVIFSDLGLNANNLRGVLQGTLYFSEGLPAEAGGGQAPYPPGQYLTLAPLLLVLGSGGSGIDLALLAGNALLDSLLIALIWLTLHRAGAGERAALFGALLYLLPPPLLRSFGIGELANIFGQALAMVTLLGWLSLRPPQRLKDTQNVAPGVWRPQNMRAGIVTRSPGAVGGAARWVMTTALLLGLALLGHLGVSISLACLLGALLLCWVFAPPPGRSAACSLALAGSVAAVAALLLYYSAFGDVLAARLASGDTAPGHDLSTALTGLGRRAIRELRPGGILYPPLVALGLLGLARYGGLRPGLASLLSAWWLGTLLSLGLLLFARQGVRWEHFLYPGLCLGTGLALALLSRRGRAGLLGVGLLVAASVWYGLELWYNQLRAYLH